MDITLEKIDLLRKRADVSYKEAKEALEKNGGDIVEALAYLEEQNKIRPEKQRFDSSSFVQKVKSLYMKASKIRFVISKNDSTILNIPLTLAVLLAILAMPLAIASVILALVTNCKIRFIKSNGEECSSINSSIDNVASKISDFTDKVVQEVKNS